jgi:mono/diheme cytochrome c family protein
MPVPRTAAQDIGRASQGRELAQRVCAECHAVLREQARSPNEAAPSFAFIAGIPGMTAIALNVALTTSHRAMPNIMLEADERADIVAYILSLK